jgi:hypothetical protein
VHGSLRCSAPKQKCEGARELGDVGLLCDDCVADLLKPGGRFNQGAATFGSAVGSWGRQAPGRH